MRKTAPHDGSPAARGPESVTAPVRVLFVCTGNICRSPTAEAVLRAQVERAGLAGAIHVDSCGTHGYHVGEPPDPRSIAHAGRRGYALAHLRARRLAAGDFTAFDHLVALDRGHRDILLTRAPHAARHKIALLMDFVPDLGLVDVPDPYYGGATDFEHVLDLVERACEGLLRAIAKPAG